MPQQVEIAFALQTGQKKKSHEIPSTSKSKRTAGMPVKRSMGLMPMPTPKKGLSQEDVFENQSQYSQIEGSPKAKKGRFVFKRPIQTPPAIEDEFAMDDSLDEILTQEPHQIAVHEPNEITTVKEPTSKPRTSTDISGPENKEKGHYFRGPLADGLLAIGQF